MWIVLTGRPIHVKLPQGYGARTPTALGGGNINTWEPINLVLHTIQKAAFSEGIFA